VGYLAAKKHHMKLWSTLFLSFFICHFVQAQISGYVTDDQNRPLPGATVRLYYNGDSTIRKTAVTDSKGYFRTEGQTTNAYIRIFFTGFQITELKTYNRNLGVIRMIPISNTLEQITVTGRQPLVQQETDRTVINVNRQVLKIADNAVEIMRLAPGLMITDNEEGFSINGKDAVAVMINDKLIKMSSRDLMKLLKSMPSASISQLEVMNNPSSKYDITGNTALLNFKIRKNVNQGLTGNLSASSSQGTKNMGDASALLNYGAKRLATSGYFAYHYGNYQTTYDKSSLINNETLKQQNISLDQWCDPVIRINADYYTNEKNTIGVLLEREASTNTAGYQTISTINEQLAKTNGYNPNKRRWNTYNLNYRFSDTLGNDLNMDVDRSDYLKNDESNITTGQHNSIRYLTHTDIRITTLKTDYTKAWKNSYKLETGVKISNVKTGNTFSKTDGIGNTDFAYREKVNSIYLNLSKSYHKWGWQIGFRLEQSRVTGIATSGKAIPIKEPDSAYVNLMPALYLSYTPSASHHFRLSFNQRIKRPDYSDLQPFTYQIDPFNYQTGNSGLRVQRNSNAELSYTYRDKITLTAGYVRTSDLFNAVLFQDKGITFQTTQNTGTLDNWNLNINYPVKITSWWSMINKLSGAHNHFSGLLYQGFLDLGNWNYVASTSQRFNLPNKFQLQVSARYSSVAQNLIYHQGSSANTSIALNRKILNEQGSFKFTFSDIFKTQRNNVTVDFGGIRYTQQNLWESRRIGLEFNWRFGNNKTKKTRTRETGNDEEKNRSSK
jgi:iron complex outermembrane receptor protein